MNIQIFGAKKCKDTQKALRFFKERGIPVHFVDLIEKSLSKGELRNITQKISMDDLINKESKEYNKLNLQYMEFDLEDELLKNSLLIKTPIVRNGNISTVGLCERIWKEWIKS